MRELNALGLEVTPGVGKTGVIAMIEGVKPGRTVMLRFDMDALPIQEQTGAEYASENPGVMHACGHDGHTAVGLTVARMLQSRREELPGAIKLVFQPAEEGLGGAESMIADGVLQNPKPDLAIGLHLWNDHPLGWMGISSGPVMAAGEIFLVRITGKGGHAAIPNQVVDPVVTSAQVVVALQSIVSRNISPLKTGVVSVATIHAGETFNVIPPVVELKGTIRTFDPDVRQQVIERFQQVVTGVASAMGCHADIDMKPLAPAVVNTDWVTKAVQSAAKALFPGSELETDYRTMGSEDMAFFLQEVPGCFFFVGSGNPEKSLNAPHHHPRFDFDEDVLPRAAALMASAAMELLTA